LATYMLAGQSRAL